MIEPVILNYEYLIRSIYEILLGYAVCKKR